MIGNNLRSAVLNDNNNSYYILSATALIILSYYIQQFLCISSNSLVATPRSIYLPFARYSYPNVRDRLRRDFAARILAARTPFSVVKRNESDGPLSRFLAKTDRFRPQCRAAVPRRPFISIMTVRNNFYIRGPH